MKRIKYVLISLLVLLPLVVSAKGDILISNDNLVIEQGKRLSFDITADNVAGVIEIMSLDPSIASVSIEHFFFDTSENINKATVIVTGIKKGNTSIDILLKDIATFDYEELKGTKKVNVSIVTNAYHKEDLNITKFEIKDYPINFKKDIKEYQIDVDENTKELILDIEGDNIKVNPTGKIDITDKDKINIVVSNENITSEYVIKINRISKTNEIVRKLLIIILTVIVTLIILHKVKKEKSQ